MRKDPALSGLEHDLRALLATWFDVDFLELRRITWDTASGALLEKLIAYEAVHPIESWNDLKDRLDYDRRYFAYFHPRMPNEPLIFVEVALVNGMAANVQALLDPAAPVQDPKSADTAIFYSINNAQRGLDGISFGNFLIKRVVDRLSKEFPNLKTFADSVADPGVSALAEDGAGAGRPRPAAGVRAQGAEQRRGRHSGSQGLAEGDAELDRLARRRGAGEGAASDPDAALRALSRRGRSARTARRSTRSRIFT